MITSYVNIVFPNIEYRLIHCEELQALKQNILYEIVLQSYRVTYLNTTYVQEYKTRVPKFLLTVY